MKLKLDTNNLMRQLDEELPEESGCRFGMELLCDYLREMAEHAIKTEDEFEIHWCKNLLIVTETAE